MRDVLHFLLAIVIALAIGFAGLFAWCGGKPFPGAGMVSAAEMPSAATGASQQMITIAEGTGLRHSSTKTGDAGKTDAGADAASTTAASVSTPDEKPEIAISTIAPTGEEAAEQEANPLSADEFEITDHIFSYGQDESGAAQVSAILAIRNKSDQNLYVSASRFEILDDANEVVDTFRTIAVFPDVIAPGEMCYLSLPRGSVLRGEADPGAHYRLAPYISAEPSQVGPYEDLDADNLLLTDDNGKLSLSGSVTNTSGEDLMQCQVQAIAFDQSGKVAAAGRVKLRDLLDGNTQDFKLDFSPSELTRDQISDYQVFCRPPYAQ